VDANLKQYADSLYDQSRSESSRKLIEDRTKFAHEMATRRRTTDLPISGPEIQALMNLFAQHVERCMEERLESYQTAYTEAIQNPNEAEFREILESVKNTQKSESQNSAHALTNFVSTQGGFRGVPFDLITRTAHGHDRVLAELKVWQAKSRLGQTREVGDEKFARIALEEAALSAVEDERVHPKVGAVVVASGTVLAKAHRGELPGSHAEFMALERKLSEISVAGATVYTTLEPCTTRNHPKIPCAARLIERKIKRVVIGMLDPDPRISGRGQMKLRAANIVTDFFPHAVMTEVEELNRKFIRKFQTAATNDQVIEKWVSLGYEHKSGIAKTLSEQGFDLGWVSADRESDRLEFEHWEYVVVDQPDGTRARLKIHDSPAIGGYLVLLKRRKTLG
jgi:pyrimidine deaminase RibD-like protein